MAQLETSRCTPYDDNYRSCERAEATLLIYSGDLSPDEVSTILKARATQTLEKGRSRVNAIGRAVEDKLNAWFLSTSELASLDIRRHLDQLLDAIEQFKDGLFELQKIHGVSMRIDCIWWSRGSGGPVLWPEQMRRIADFNLELAFDIYFFEEEQELT